MTLEPRAQYAQDLADVLDATSRFTLRVDRLTDADLDGPSLLPGWTRAHVVGHVALNAAGMVNLVTWAVTGETTPMYPSLEARATGIHEAAALPPAALRGLLAASADALDVAMSRLVAADDAAIWRLLLFGAPTPGAVPDVPAWTLGWARLRELEIHHLDLDAGLEPSDWPEPFVERMVDFLDGRGSAPAVTGNLADVVAWRLGRGPFRSVRGIDGSDPGEPPPW